jgi:hypothetical protein
MADTAEIQNSAPVLGGAKVSSADLQRIFEDARKFSAQYASFAKASEVMGALGSIEQAVAESQQRLKVARDAEAAAVQDAKAAAAARAIDHAAELKRQDAELAAKRREAEQVSAAARADERSIVDLAKKAAEKIVNTANQNAAVAGGQVEFRRQELRKLETDIADREIELVELDKQVEQKRAKLKEVADEHARFLAKIGAH